MTDHHDSWHTHFTRMTLPALCCQWFLVQKRNNWSGSSVIRSISKKVPVEPLQTGTHKTIGKTAFFGAWHANLRKMVGVSCKEKDSQSLKPSDETDT